MSNDERVARPPLRRSMATSAAVAATPCLPAGLQRHLTKLFTAALAGPKEQPPPPPAGAPSAAALEGCAAAVVSELEHLAEVGSGGGDGQYCWTPSSRLVRMPANNRTPPCPVDDRAAAAAAPSAAGAAPGRLRRRCRLRHGAGDPRSLSARSPSLTHRERARGTDSDAGVRMNRRADRWTGEDRQSLECTSRSHLSQRPLTALAQLLAAGLAVGGDEPNGLRALCAVGGSFVRGGAVLPSCGAGCVCVCVCVWGGYSRSPWCP